MYEYILENLPGNPRWEGTFYERLVEDAVWDRDEFWKLHLALTNAAISIDSLEDIDRQLAWAVAEIQSTVWRSVAAHYNQNDVFVIGNLASDELHEYVERFDHAILSVFSREVLAESAYDLTNPLIGGV